MKCPECNNKYKDDFKFCPYCGTKAPADKICPECGFTSSEFVYCPNCGKQLLKPKDLEKKILEEPLEDNLLIESKPMYGKHTITMENTLKDSKLMDGFIDLTSGTFKFIHKNAMNLPLDRTFMKILEPEFVEIYDTINDSFLQTLFVLEREKIGPSGGWADMTLFGEKPTKKLSYEDSKKFYIQLLNKIKYELALEKQKPDFSEKEYYKKKLKEAKIEHISNFGAPRNVR